MLLVKTFIKETEGKGIGLFASEKIYNGSLCHKTESEFDRVFDEDWVKQNNMLDFFLKYSTYDESEKVFYLCSDNARFINHSYTPNTDGQKDFIIANRDIEAGEEITINYLTICDIDKKRGFVDFEVI